MLTSHGMVNIGFTKKVLAQWSKQMRDKKVITF